MEKKEKKRPFHDWPSMPDNYIDHRKFVYDLCKTKVSKPFHSTEFNEVKEMWSVVQYRNVRPPRIVNVWNFNKKEEAETFIKKNEFILTKKQN